ncbi:MAG: aminoacyl-tRNA hydrolase [Eubacteriales bacterium]|nr:aminoacyl-tRNA hydrolase [Eubacteriales bacterium]
MILIVGLGNPDSKYLMTRHNMGFWAVDELCQNTGIVLKEQYNLGVYGRGRIGGQDVVVVKPTTYMNDSGVCVYDMMRRFHVEMEDIYVIYDDMDLPVGKLRMRGKGGPGTHNGMRSVVAHLQGENFPRVRIGIGEPAENENVIAFVLGKPKGEELDALRAAARQAAEAVQEAVAQGLEAAMQRCNQ